jgi:hypothetical protein
MSVETGGVLKLSTVFTRRPAGWVRAHMTRFQNRDQALIGAGLINAYAV